MKLRAHRQSTRTPVAPDRHLLRLALAQLCLAAFAGSIFAATNWQSNLTSDPPGNFPELRPLRVTYKFGWSGFTAATGDVHFNKSGGNHFELEANGRTIGLVRALWRMDVNYRGLCDAETLRPIESKQTETYPKKKMITQLTFNNSGVTRARTEGLGTGMTKTRQFSFQNLNDLHSALFYLRSQPLKDHSVYRIVVFPTTSAYLATITVLGREKTSVRAGSYNAIKTDIQLYRVGKNMELEPHRKFRRATVWISDDANRIPVRIEAQIFVGTVFAELQTIHFDQEKS